MAFNATERKRAHRERAAEAKLIESARKSASNAGRNTPALGCDGRWTWDIFESVSGRGTLLVPTVAVYRLVREQ